MDFYCFFDGFLMDLLMLFLMVFTSSGSSELGRDLQKNGPFFLRSGSSELGEDTTTSVEVVVVVVVVAAAVVLVAVVALVAAVVAAVVVAVVAVQHAGVGDGAACTRRRFRMANIINDINYMLVCTCASPAHYY